MSYARKRGAPMGEDALRPHVVGMREATIVQDDPCSKKEAFEPIFVQDASDALDHSHALEDLGQMTASVIHDVNNQLTAILCAAPLLSRAVAGNETASMLAGEIHTAAERAAELTRRALTVVRRRRSRPQSANLSECVAASRELIELAAGKRVELTLALEPNLSGARFGRDQLDHVLLHLAAGARERMPHGGTLTIATYDAPIGTTAPAYVALAVSDTGEAMPPEDRERLFQRMGGGSRAGTAAWLGVSAAYSFAKRNGGCISLHSAPGQGTRVVVYLPRA